MYFFKFITLFLNHITNINFFYFATGVVIGKECSCFYRVFTVASVNTNDYQQ